MLPLPPHLFSLDWTLKNDLIAFQKLLQTSQVTRYLISNWLFNHLS